MPEAEAKPEPEAAVQPDAGDDPIDLELPRRALFAL